MLKPIRTYGTAIGDAGHLPARKFAGLEQPKCRRCGASLILRTNRQSQSTFYGCSKFPTCRFTKKA